MKHKTLRILFGITLTMLLLFSATHTATADNDSWEITTGVDILIYVGDSFHDEPFYFNETYWDAGNNVTIVEDYDFVNEDLADWDAIFFSNYQSNFTEANLTAIASWYDSGDKLLWVGGESDFGGYHNATKQNELLWAVKSILVLDLGSIEDPESNDGAAYRVVGNTTGVSSAITDKVTESFEYMIFHGPTAVTYYDYVADDYTDLRSQDLTGTGVDILVNSSANAVAVDGDTTISSGDVYAYSAAPDGNYPMIATQQYNNSMVVVSGEVVFDDYKEMYDWIFENQLTSHDGIRIVDSIIAYWFTDFGLANKVGADTSERIRVVVTETETETESETETTTATTTITEEQTVTETKSPFFALPVIAALALIPVGLALKRKLD